MERTLWTDERIDDAMDRIDQRFDRVDRRFDQVDQRIDRLDTKVDALGDRLETRMDEGFREMRGELAALNARLFNGLVALIAALLSICIAIVLHSL